MTVSRFNYVAVLIGDPPTSLELKSGTITLDAGTYPHVQADIVIGPVSLEVFDALDPRLHPRIRITAYKTVSDMVTAIRTFDLGVRARPIRYLDGDYGLRLASDEAILTDYAVMEDDDSVVSIGNVRTLVNRVLNHVLPGTVLEPGVGAPMPEDAAEDALVWRAGDSAMAYLQPILEAVGLRLVCDEERLWTLRDEGFTVPGSILVSYLVNLIDAAETMDRDSGLWFDAAVTRYRWTDTTGTVQEAVDAYTSVTPPTKVVAFDKDKAFPGVGFSAYAVRRAQGRGREIAATAVADWRARCEQALEFRLPGTPTQTGTSQAVRFDVSRDEMTVTARTADTPASAWVLLDAGEAWLDSPVGESWTEEVV